MRLTTRGAGRLVSVTKFDPFFLQSFRIMLSPFFLAASEKPLRQIAGHFWM